MQETSNSHTMELQDILDLFRFLFSPFEGEANDLTRVKPSLSPSGNSPQAILQEITQHCLTQIDFLLSSRPFLNNYDSADGTPPQYSSWDLTCVILSILSKLKIVLEDLEAKQSEEEKAIEILSIQSQIIVQKSVELTIGFGIVPYLLPGLGVPEKLRKMNPSVSRFLSDVNSTTPFQQFLRLSHTIENLLICSRHPSLNALILPKYTSDILAGLLQICKSPLARPKNIAQPKPGALSEEQYGQALRIRDKLQTIMTNTFLVYVPKSTLINSLFLIGANEKPRWISATCNEQLCEILLSQNGLISVSTTMLESAGPSDTWKLMRVISSLMKNAVIKSGDPTCHNCHKKLRSLSDQCMQMLTQQNEDESLRSNQPSSGANIHGQNQNPSSNFQLLNGELLKIGLFCGLTLMDIDFEFAKSVFWNKLFYHALSLESCQRNVESVGTINGAPSTSYSMRAQEVAASITYAECLLSLMKPMSISFPLKLTQPVWSLFLQIFVACGRYLKKPVQEPNVAAVAEQLYHKLKDVLILLFEIYSSGAGQNLVLPLPTSASSIDEKTKVAIPKENVDLCDFTMMLLLNHQFHDVPVLNTFDLRSDSENGHVEIVRLHQESISDTSNYSIVFEHNLDVSCLMLCSDILKDVKLRGIWSLLFRQLLSWGTKKHGQKTSSLKQSKIFKSDIMPTSLGKNDSEKVNLTDCQRFISFKLLGELGDEESILEQLGNAENLEETLAFLELLLNKFTSEACHNTDNEFDASQLVMYALGIIGALVETACMAEVSASLSSYQSSTSVDKEVKDDMWNSLEMFIPHLRKLSQCSQSSLVRMSIPEMASNLVLSIATRGAAGETRKSKNNAFHHSRFQLAVDDASNPLVHIKGHGVLELKRLIEQRDEETLQNEHLALKIFQNNLRNEDSYVYLMSIQGLAALALKFHKTVVPELIREYDFMSYFGNESDNNTAKSEDDDARARMYNSIDKEEQIETRMKLGEILVKVVQRLGDFAPSYRVPLTNVFFRQIRDDEPLIRASALSNLGELCHLLKFSLGVVLTEVWFCVESILTTEKNVHVRRAALHLLVLLLQGIEKGLPVEAILSDNTVSQHLRDVRRFLTQTEKTEVDLVAKTHCQLALNELGFIVKKLLTPTNSLQFKIQVLDVLH